jgi:hypothetical protein
MYIHLTFTFVISMWLFCYGGLNFCLETFTTLANKLTTWLSKKPTPRTYPSSGLGRRFVAPAWLSAAPIVILLVVAALSHLTHKDSHKCARQDSCQDSR